MAYSFEKLQSIAECDQLLKLANKEKSELLYRKMANSRSHDSFEENSQDLLVEVQKVEAALTSNAIILAALPEGEAKQDAVMEKARLEYRKLQLGSRQKTGGSLALLMKEMEQSFVDQNLEEASAFITALEAHKGTL